MEVWLLVVALTLTLLLFDDVEGHGRLLEPVSRSSMWRKGFKTPKNYNDNQLFCGGFYNQQYLNRGQCGVCGDPAQGPRQNEAGGIYATGQIVRTYTSGQVIDIQIQITANHLGWFEFRLCSNNNPKKAVTHECLNKHLLPLANGAGTRYVIGSDTGMYNLKVKLPPGLTCTQCVLQWKWHTGNSFGVDLLTHRGCVGCGPQEEFYGCSDIAISGHGSQGHPQPVATSFPWQPKPTDTPPIYHQSQRPTVHQSTQRLPLYTPRPLFGQPTPRPVRPTPHGSFVYQPTQRPIYVPAKTQGPVVSPSNCRAVNLWAGIPQLDKWCVDNCVVRRCPPIYCRCS
ncbi:uncharacterized protein LOC121387844 [Gigantopelta aegis]|uniref:uncharacterized protein LOC121387844 n=1 Tax=Gigantopelta aegis TaxID=1735272 RepID=UPI001B88DAE5|nr:uncharacterized protein LOC121387844 [Gigantopelta aegis]